jgi:hypothetical protein
MIVFQIILVFILVFMPFIQTILGLKLLIKLTKIRPNLQFN